MTFDFYAKYGLFTYSQCGDLDPWEVVAKFTELGAECIIGRESHVDGGTHLHAFVDFNGRRRFRRADFADVSGSHPNISPSRRTPWDGYDYAIKDGDVVAGGLERPRRPGSDVCRKDEVWSTIISAETRDEFWARCRELAPADLARSFPSLSKFADWQYAEPDYVYDGPTRGDARFCTEALPELESWCRGLDDSLDGQRGKHVPLPGVLSRTHGGPSGGKPPLARIRSAHTYTGRGKSLVLWGPTRTGKTTWARSLGAHIYFGGLFSGGAALAGGSTANYAVFDDIRGGIKFFPGFKDWLGCQSCFMVKQLYREPMLFKWGRVSIWISNKDPRLELDEDDVQWMEGNCQFVYVGDSIFRANTE